MAVSPRRRRYAFPALVLVAVGWAMIANGWGGNQTSHFALTRAIASGTPKIERTLHEVGTINEPTGDISLYHGHVYSNKAPGLAFYTVPGYLLMKGAGEAKPPADPTGQLWWLSLWSAILPGLLLLFLVCRIADDLEPGFGTAAAVTLGVATMILSFATLFYSHNFAATLGFAAFAFLWYERRGPERLAWLVAAGALAGYSITTEFPTAISAVILGLYAIARTGLVRRGLAYAGGVLVGLVPLLAFDWWAFGSPVHISYQSTVGFGSTKTLFLGVPHFRRGVEVLFSPQAGLLTLSPVVALVAVGAVLLYRAGHRPEGLLFGGLALAYLVFDTSYLYPYDEASPGMRQMIPMLPFAAVALAPVYRRFPVTTILLTGASAVETIVLTSTRPLSATFYRDWFHRFSISDFSQTVFGLEGGPREYGVYALIAAVVLAAGLAAVASARPSFSWRDLLSGSALLAGWILIVARAPSLLKGDELGAGNGAFTLLLFAAAIVLVAVFVPRTLVPAPARVTSSDGRESPRPSLRA